MISLPATIKIFLCTQPADMRKSFDGLKSLVEQFLECDPLSGHLFVFRNRRSDRLKILYWDRDGLAIWYKRLEVGTFRFPALKEGQVRAEVQPAELTMLLDGVDLASVKRSRRYQRTA
jgi:transposase